MGLDLKLLVLLGDTPNFDMWLGHTIITTGRDYYLYDTIKRQVDEKAIPEGKTVWSYFHDSEDDPDAESTYGEMYTNPYGEPLTWVTAGELADAFQVARQAWLKADINEAIYQFLRALPATWKIVLYWC